MGTGKDKKQRKRRNKTDAEKQETLRKKNAERQRKDQAKYGSVAGFFSTTPREVSVAGGADVNTITGGDDVELIGDDATGSDEVLMRNDPEPEVADDIITFTEEIDPGVDMDPMIVADLDVDDDDSCGALDEAAEPEPEVVEPTKLKRGVQLDYMRAINDRLWAEVRDKTKAFEPKWLIEHLKHNDGWVRKEQAKSIIQMLKSKNQSESTFKDATVSWSLQNKLYYRDIKVWLPDILMLGGFAPFCPTCKCNSHVSIRACHSNHIGRLIIGLTQNYHVLTVQYKCGQCEEKKKQLVREAIATAAATGEPQPKVKYQYTFMGWDPESLPLTAYGCGDEFPALLSPRAGIDKTLVDMMRAEFDKGTRPEAFSNMILELHAKEHTRSWLRYEREYSFEIQKKARLGLDVNCWDEFSSFNDSARWNDSVPTGKYFASVYKKHSRSIRSHLNKEVKKRGATVLSSDVSYKEARNLCQHKGHAVYNGLDTKTNECGEVRLQYHVVSDSHEQSVAPLEAFKQTSMEYGLPLPRIIHTDDPSRDCNFYLNSFESLQLEKQRMNSGLSRAHTNANPYPYDVTTPYLKIVDKPEDISLAVSSMREIMNTDMGFAFDCEHKVAFNGRGMRTTESKIGLIQIAYFNRHDNDRIHHLFVRTYDKVKLPGPLVSLLSSNIPVVGVNIGGDLARVGRDFGLEIAIGRRPKESIVNLGTYARKRDVIPNGTIGMKPLIKIVLGFDIDKHEHDTFSDWNAPVLTPSQTKYALIDVDGPLRVYEALSKLPDLSLRLTLEEAVVGKRVDIVPRYGSVMCMATRAATGRIIDAEHCESPDGIAQAKVRAGRGMAAVQLETVYSPALEIPYYRKNGSPEKPTLADFGTTQLVLPIQMLKEHVQSESVRPYSLDARHNENQFEGTTPPAPNANSASTNLESGGTAVQAHASDECTVDATGDEGPTAVDVGEGDDLTDDYPSEEELARIRIDLTSSDIETLRACAVEGQSTTNRTPLQCEFLQQPPKADDIEDVFSPLLGDVFHAMQRPYVPVKHEAKKGYFVALQNAFFVWNKDQMDNLESKMMSSGLTREEIEKMKYYNSQLFINCVEREVPPPSCLYWRVRAVFAMYGNMMDSKTGKPLFNANAWNKAKGVLREILKGYYSDPPGVSMYNKRTRNDGSLYKNKYGIDMIECIRGTNRTEAYHKNLIVTFRSWHTGIEMSDALLSERRHRHNHRMSQLRRHGYPTLGHYDTWLIDQLQTVVLENRGIILYPNWSNASEYKDTNESFDTVALHSRALHEALMHEWENRIDQTKVKLTSDQKYMRERIGTPLPFLPFSTKEENIAFAQCALSNDFPMDNPEAAAIQWCKLVNGVDIFPKLPVHIRIHKESFQKNQRIRDCVELARSGQEKLNELNNALRPIVAANSDPAVRPEALPLINPNAMHDLPYVVTGGTAIGILPTPVQLNKRKIGQRGKDKQTRRPKRCTRCVENGGQYAEECKGRGGAVHCQYYDDNESGSDIFEG
eukprot:scaffold4428_cov57-Cyclotella_meneghiniana.AAC.1